MFFNSWNKTFPLPPLIKSSPFFTNIIGTLYALFFILSIFLFFIYFKKLRLCSILLCPFKKNKSYEYYQILYPISQ